MDRYTGSDQQLGDGPIRMRRATAEDAKWLDRMSGNAGRAGDQSGGGGNGGDNYIEFDDDNPYVSCESICSFNCWCSHIYSVYNLLLVCSYIEALRAWASQLAKRITIEDAQEEVPCQFVTAIFHTTHSVLFIHS